MKPLFAAITVNDGAELPEITPVPEADKTLVVYYSATGTTERVANYIANAADADIFELEPVDPYTSADLNYSNSQSRVVREHDNPELQDIELVSTSVPNWDEYDTVFIGYPIWWHSASWVVYNFVKDNDFTGKTVIPFSTSASSGEVGDDIIKDMTATGDWQTGRGFRSSESRNETLIKTWVDGLNLK
ncbi:MAG: flavodoxin [bacterium]|nr:flavodoxin [bacterium]